MVLCLVPWFAMASGCNGCEEKKIQARPAVDLPEVPAPAHHVADVFIPKPEETFLNIRSRVGGPLALLPGTFPSVVVTMLGLSPQLLEQIDGKSPSFGVITDDGERLVVVMGVHVRDGWRTVQLLTEGADAKYTAKPVDRGVVVLEPRPALTSRVTALGVAGNYLLTAEKAEDLLACGPYVSGTLPKRPGLEGEIVLQASKAALAGPISKRIRDTWGTFRKEREKDDEELRKQKGRAPDFGEPAAALADVQGRVEGILSLLSDLERAQVRMDTDATGIHATVTMVPAAGGGYASKEFASLVTGDLSPLLSMPQDTVLGVLMRDDPQGRRASATKQADGLVKLLGERIKEGDKEKVHAALSSWAEGRGDWMAASLRWTREDQEAIVRGSVADAKALDTGIRSMLALATVPGFREPLEHHLGKLTVGKVEKAGAGSFLNVKRERKATQEGQKPSVSTFDLAWRTAPEGFELRGREDGKGWLTSAEDGKQPTLGEHPTTSKVFEGTGTDASFVLFLDPQLFLSSLAPKGAKVKEPNAPFVFAYGGETKQGWFKVALSHASAREIIKLLGRK
jgi:hypothetical protein